MAKLSGINKERKSGYGVKDLWLSSWLHLLALFDIFLLLAADSEMRPLFIHKAAVKGPKLALFTQIPRASNSPRTRARVVLSKRLTRVVLYKKWVWAEGTTFWSPDSSQNLPQSNRPNVPQISYHFSLPFNDSYCDSAVEPAD
jgi:hypothetical protein